MRSNSRPFFRSVWLFPTVLFILVCLLGVLKISGTSEGVYRQILYGQSKDPNLILGQPRAIRSDEWLVNTQLTVAQAKIGYPRVNPNLGNGEDVSLMNDVPYKDWSAVFRPQNLIFFVSPLENAFAFKWWLIGYLLIVSCYFFILELLPGKRLLAIILSLSLFFSAFIQWWYLYGTLAPIFYSFFIATVVILLVKQRNRWKQVILGVLLTYLLVCFALVLYPPFQIACGLVLIAFIAGYLLENYSAWGKRQFWRWVIKLATCTFIALAIVGVFISTRHSAIKAIENTAYPGTRSIKSGGTGPDHFLASNLGHQFINDDSSSQYLVDDKTPSNQSETSNFLLLAPFLFIPAVIFIYRDYRQKRLLDWSLLFLCLLFVVFLLELFVPQFTPISKLLLLNKVGSGRLLIGMGLLNILMALLLVRNIAKKKLLLSGAATMVYSLVILAIELLVSLHAHYKFGTFIGFKHAILFSLPVPLIIYLLLKKRFTAAFIIYLAFSLYISVGVNPLYKGLGALAHTPLDSAIQKTYPASKKRWISDGGYSENLALINGRPSLTGVYNYPQPSLWESISGVQKSTYNRYAHVGSQISSDPNARSSLLLLGHDSFVLKSSACSSVLKNLNVGFFVTSGVVNSPCAKLVDTTALPAIKFNIYSLN